MDAEKLIYLLKHPALTKSSDIPTLSSVISNYPYFQAPKAIQLKALKDSGSFVYNQKLKETAAFTTDREVLFNFISSKIFNTKKSLIEKVKINKTEGLKEKLIVVDKPIVTIEEQNLITTQNIQKPEVAFKEKNTLDPKTPLQFSSQEKHSFAEWLNLTSIQPIFREQQEKPKKKRLIESPLIDTFLKNNPKIKPVKKTAPVTNLVTKNTTEAKDLMTETLAKVYLAQGNYKRAIQAYKILSLKNPEKSGLFADQIRAIQKLQDNN